MQKQNYHHFYANWYCATLLVKNLHIIYKDPYKDMNQPTAQQNTIIKLAGYAAITLMANYFIFQKLIKPKKTHEEILTQQKINSEKEVLRNNKMKIQRKQSLVRKVDKGEKWGILKIQGQIDQNDGLLDQLKQMDSLLFEVQRVNNLIIDLELTKFKTVKCQIVLWKNGEVNQRAYMNEKTLVQPGQFIIKQCTFKPGLTLELQKKFMRAGPRSTQYFRSEQVRADIVCLGNISPGMNTVIRQLVLILRNIYNVDKVYGVKYSFKGYYENNIIELDPQMLETAHHMGGCYLGLCKTQFNIRQIIESLENRGINQLYLIGANSTLAAAKQIYEQIKKRSLNIAVSVLLKGINRDIPIFDTCFGFQTAAEQAAQIVSRAYAYSHTFKNGLSLVKLPGRKSGFLAAQTVLSTINANICLVPQIPFDLYGERGLINFIVKRMKVRGNCTIVFSEGVQSAIRDCCIIKKSGVSQHQEKNFEQLLIQELTTQLNAEKITSHNIGLYNCVEEVRSAPANSIDTKLCCQIAQASIHGAMCGYTNFAIGHLANKNAMVPIDQLINSEATTFLRENSSMWQRVLGSTGQPTFLNEINSMSNN